MTVQLLRLMRRDPLQRQLPIESHREFEDGTKPQASAAWRETSLDELFDPAKTLRKALAEAGLDTVGQLADYSATEKRLTDIPGIGPGKAQEIEDRMMSFWEDNQDSVN